MLIKKIICCFAMPIVIAEATFVFGSTRKYETEADSLYNLSWDYLYSDLDSAMLYANLLEENISHDKDNFMRVKKYYIKGHVFNLKKHFDVAASSYYQGLDLLNGKEDYENKRLKIFLLQSLGVVYERTFSYDNALTYYRDALEIANEIDLKNSIAELHYNIAVVYKLKGDYFDALIKCESALNVSELIGNDVLSAKINNLIGLVYDSQNEFEQARQYYLRSLDISRNNIDLKNEVAIYQSNIGENFFLQEDYGQAKKHYSEALAISINNKDTTKIKWIYNNLGDVYIKENKFEEAIQYFNNAIALGNNEVLDEELQRAYKNIAQAYEALGKYKLASEYKSGYIAQADKVMAIKEDLSQQNAQYRMKELDWQRQLMQKETMLAGAEKENFWGRVIIGIALLLILISARLIFVYYRKISQARKVVNSYSVDNFDF